MFPASLTFMLLFGWLFLDPVVFLFIEQSTCMSVKNKIRMVEQEHEGVELIRMCRQN